MLTEAVTSVRMPESLMKCPETWHRLDGDLLDSPWLKTEEEEAEEEEEFSLHLLACSHMKINK